MEGETITISNSHESKRSVETISILVVDDDTTCLSIVASILKKFKYEVVTVKHPNDALCTLRIKNGAFDLVVSDVHMPDINGFELQQTIAQEFNLPVVLMSVDDKETVALKGLESGAAFFIMKPVCPDDLRDLWQFAATKKKSQVVIEETENFPEERNNSDDQTTISISSVNENKRKYKKYTKRKPSTSEGSEEIRGGSSSQTKKPKVVWGNSLHNRFLEAIRNIGLERAVPKKILEVMNVPGLTRENVASHLQKYRIFLRRVSDASYRIQSSAGKGSSSSKKPLLNKSSVASPMQNKFSTLQNQNSEVLFPRGKNIASSSFLSHEASSSNPIPQPRFELSRLLIATRNANPNPQSDSSPVQTSPSLTQRDHNLSNISLMEDFSTGSMIGSNRFNSNINIREIPSNTISTIWTPSIVSSMPSKYSNYVGYKISNSQTRPNGWNSWNGTRNLPSTMKVADMNESTNAIDLDQLLAQLMGGSSSSTTSLVNENASGENLLDVMADYQSLLQPSSLPLSGNMEIGVGINSQEPAFSQMLDLPVFTTQPLVGGDLTSMIQNPVITQNLAQQNGGENGTSSTFCDTTSHWSNIVATSRQTDQNKENSISSLQEFDNTTSQLSETFLAPDKQACNVIANSVKSCASNQLTKNPRSPNEHEEDDFLESLLATAPYGEEY